MKKTLFFSFLIITVFHIYSEESNTVELPSKFSLGEIVYLKPYPVTTKSTNNPKEITLLDQVGEEMANIGVIVCYNNGQSIKYTSSREGRIVLGSSRQIDQIYILGFEENRVVNTKKSDNTTNSITMIIEWNSLPFMIDMEPFPADQFTLILTKQSPFRVSY